MKKFIINRFEGSYAVCEAEDKSTSMIPKYKLPLECNEGDCLILNNNGMYDKLKEHPKEKKKKLL